MSGGTPIPAIRHIASPRSDSDVFATARFENEVTVWSIRERRALATIDTVMDFGGERLAVLGEPDVRVVAGVWERHGICAYDLAGELVWQRKDLKKPQVLKPVFGESTLAAALEARPLHVLARATGETVATVRDTWDVETSPYAPLAVTSRGGTPMRFTLRDTDDWSVIWKAKLEPFLVVADYAFSEDALLLKCWGEPGEDVSRYCRLVCLDLENGGERWRWVADRGTAPDAMAWNRNAGAWVVVEGEDHRPHRLVTFDPDGRRGDELKLEQYAAVEFLTGGSLLVTSHGELLEAPSGRLVWRFLEDWIDRYD